MARRNHDFQTIRSEGGLLPADLLRRVLDPKSRLEGTRPEDYGLPPGDRLNEAITQSWNRLRRHWTEFRKAADTLPEGEAGTGLTNDRWSMPLLRELGFGPVPSAAGPTVSGQAYAIGRFLGPVPLHLVGCGLSLDRRAAGMRGAAAGNPHGLVQDFLNRSPNHLWGIVTNGWRWRVLRDNQALSRQSFLEFDLEAMFSGEVFSDFVLFWLVLHATRLMPRDGGKPESCWLERWTAIAAEQGARALTDLRGGVERALQVLGEGFTSHPKNQALRDALRTGTLSLTEFHGQLLRVVYRLIFLFVAEDRTIDGIALLHPRASNDGHSEARRRYADNYGTARLRALAGQIKGSRHGDLWRQVQVLVGALSGNAAFETTREQLALPALGSFLWSPDSTGTLNSAELSNYDWLEAVRHLAFVRQAAMLRPVDYRNLGAEELGGVYESLLALTPQVSADGARFTFAEFAGSERKTTGAYYTPDSLVQSLLDSALDPVVEHAIADKSATEAERAILALKVCDPAVGSGHFLVGAAHRLARHLARVRAQSRGESEPSPIEYQRALRDVIGHCLYGVDLNPMAAELCRVSLWLEALQPGKPLSFLDHHIRVGNSLLGVTPELIAAGLPDEAFNPIEGDDKKTCAALKRKNKHERESGQIDFGRAMVAEPMPEYESLAARSRGIDAVADDRIEDVLRKAEQFSRLLVSSEYRHQQQIADAWCAAFVWPKNANAIADAVTTDTIRRLEGDGGSLARVQRAELERLAGQYQFFHWHLAFPDVFARGGFDCVLGNPPWERVKLQEREWFGERRPEIANTPNAAARKRMIDNLKQDDPALYLQFLSDSRKAEGESHMYRNTGSFPLCGRGDINVYTIFAEHMRRLLNEDGRLGCVIPTGIATDDTTKYFFQDVIETRSLASLFDFENRGVFFPNVHSSYKFCLFTAGRGLRPTAASAEFVFFASSVDDLRDLPRRFALSREDIALLNPNTRTCPIFRSRRDAELTKAIYRRVTVLLREGIANENPWGIYYLRLIHLGDHANEVTSSGDMLASGKLNSQNHVLLDGLVYLPVYEAKLINHYDHRFATFLDVSQKNALNGLARNVTPEEHGRADFSVFPRYWAKKSFFDGLIAKYRYEADWLLGFRDVCRSTDERTCISAVIPRLPATVKFPTIGVARSDLIAGLLASLQSFCLDFVARQKIGGVSLSFYIFKQLSIPAPEVFEQSCSWDLGRTISDWILLRTLELTYTSSDLKGFAEHCGYSGAPFAWDERRRYLLRCELDAALFRIYLTPDESGNWHPREGESASELASLKESFLSPRAAVDYVLESFLIVRRKEEAEYGEYRTKRVILEIYDAMQEATRTGWRYETLLDPPPADPRVAHHPSGERRSAGETYELVDLLHVDLADELVPVHLGGDVTQIFRFVSGTDPRPPRNSLVILRDARLQIGETTVPIAAGKWLWAEQRDDATGEPFVMVTLRRKEGAATLRLAPDEWERFTPLAVAE